MKTPFKSFILFMVVLTLVSCTTTPSQGDTSTTPTETLIPTTLPTLTQEPTLTATPIPIILPTPSSIVPLEERLLASIDVAFPDEMVFVQGFIWVKTDTGHVIQIDPATNSTVSDIIVDTTTSSYHYCQGLGTDGENIWACSASGDDDHRTINVVRIDSTTQNVVATVEVGKIFDQFDMPFLHNYIWVLTGDGSKLVGIDTNTNQTTQPIDLGTRCFQVAAEGDALLVTCKLDNLILRVDPESMQVMERVTIGPSPWNIRTSEDGVWVSLSNSILRLDPQTLNSVITFSKMPGDKDLFITDEAVWVRTDYGFLFRIDPASNQIIEQFWSDQRFYNMGGFLVTSDSVWTSAGDDDLVLRISIE